MNDFQLDKSFERALENPDERISILEQLVQTIVKQWAIAGAGFVLKTKHTFNSFYFGKDKRAIQDLIKDKNNAKVKQNRMSFLEQEMKIIASPNEVIYCTSQYNYTGLCVFFISENNVQKKTIMKNEVVVNEQLHMLTEIIAKEYVYFSDSTLFNQSMNNHDTITLLLTLSKMVSNADVVYWGDVYGDIVSVNMHIGANSQNFGFDLPLGEGAGGKIALNPSVYRMENYQNSKHRYPGVSTVLDAEGIKSGLVFPVKRDTDAKPIGLLYATRRSTRPFSRVEQILITRLTNIFSQNLNEYSTEIGQFYLTRYDFIQEKKNELNELLLNSQRITEFRDWLSTFLKGKVFIVDQYNNFYHEVDRDSPLDYEVEKADLKIELHGQLGFLYVFTKMKIKEKNWPSFYTDLSSVCSIILERDLKKDESVLTQRRSWLINLFDSKLSQRTLNEGVNLGLPIANGEIWVVAIPKQSSINNKQLPALMNELTIEHIYTPLTMIDNDIGIVLLELQHQADPSTYRDYLLKKLDENPIWIIHGARYNNTHQLKNRLIQSVKLVKGLRQKNSSTYISEIGSVEFGLQTLLNHPRLKPHLIEFSKKQLKRLIDYDKQHESNFLNTFIRFNILHSAQLVAKEQFLHVNTVYYRINKGKEILNINLDDPENETAIKLASFIYYFHVVKEKS